MPNISQSKGNQTTKFGHLLKYNKINIFLQKTCRKWCRDSSSRNFFLFFKKALYEVKASGRSLFQCISIALYLAFWHMPNFYFLEKGLVLVYPPHFMHDFSRKMWHVILYSQMLLSNVVHLVYSQVVASWILNIFRFRF